MGALPVALGLAAVGAVAGFALARRTGVKLATFKSTSAKNPVVAYANKMSLNEPEILAELGAVTQKHCWARMMSPPEQQQFFRMILKTLGAKKVVEVGVFTGYATLSMAMALPKDGKVVALDISQDYADVGAPFWKKAGVAGKIDLRIAPAADSLAKMVATPGEVGSYDFAFIDADKSGYDEYYERCLELVRPGGIIAVDNVLWGGAVLNESDTRPDTVAIRELNKKIKADKRVDSSLLAIADGVFFCRKL